MNILMLLYGFKLSTLWQIGCQLSRNCLDKLSFISCFFLSASSLLAGSISIQGSPQMQFTLEDGVVKVSGHVEFVNLGDETAMDVFPEVSIGAWKWTGSQHKLDPNERYRWEISSQASLFEWHCVEKYCKDFQLPLIGSYPVEIRRYYQDLNGYPFSLLAMEYVTIGQSPPQVPLIGQLEVTSYGESFTAKLSLENSSAEDLEIITTLKSTKEISIPSDQEGHKRLHIGSNERKTLRFYGENSAGLLNSVHNIFAVVFWKTNSKENLRSVKVFSDQYRIIKSRRNVYYWILGILTAFFLSIIIINRQKNPNY